MNAGTAMMMISYAALLISGVLLPLSRGPRAVLFAVLSLCALSVFSDGSVDVPGAWVIAAAG